jgi:hypothetical protein
LVSVVAGAAVEVIAVVRDYASSLVDDPHHSPVPSSSLLWAVEEEAVILVLNHLDFPIARDHSAELRYSSDVVVVPSFPLCLVFLSSYLPCLLPSSCQGRHVQMAVLPSFDFDHHPYYYPHVLLLPDHDSLFQVTQ